MATTSLIFRLAHTRDAAPIAIMSRELIEAGLGWRYDTNQVRRLILDADTVVLVAAQHKRITAFAVMQFGDDRAHLVLLAVEPARRRQGIGRRMIEWLLESAATAGIASVHLELRAGNPAARDFYRELGFADTLTIPGYYRGQESAVRMVRVLRATEPSLVPWQALLDKRRW